MKVWAYFSLFIQTGDEFIVLSLELSSLLSNCEQAGLCSIVGREEGFVSGTGTEDMGWLIQA
jgi:hypothetical protein